MKTRRIPVWLVTGYLGSGKTTLLKHWLRDPALADAALVVNEIGEVGFDDRMLASAVDSAMLLSNNCVCCTGLPGLEEALTELWWDRLHRRRPAFSSVVIETTGLADPRPIITAFGTVPFLQERYELAGVLVTASAPAGLALIEAQAEARAQVQAADLLIITKVDQANGAPLATALHALNPHAVLAQSAQASLTWPQVGALLHRAAASAPVPGHETHGHHHHAAARFAPLTGALALNELKARFDALHDDALLRLKGVVALDDGQLYTVQWAVGDPDLTLEAFAGRAPALGLTCISSGRGPAQTARRLAQP
ncbi:MAG: GTP-binding protein [Hylemonella sp.]|nr:GTP-binding protein [Hylemonella sp.]